jgi:transcriptional regulator with XRE-family HTH domain
MPHLHHFVAFLQFGFKSLKSLKPVKYSRIPKSLAGHLLKRRSELKLRQKDVARMMGIDVFTYLTWETGQVLQPDIRGWKAIIQFLGYDPNGEPADFSERLISYRRRHGLSQKKLSQLLGCDQTVLAKWENQKSVPSVKSHTQKLCRLKIFI